MELKRSPLYADADAIPTHMARQTESGTWKSKLGNLEDIEHTTLEQLNGYRRDDYGCAVRYLRRRRQSAT